MRKAIGALAALALAGCAAQPPAGARPAMWRLADEDTTIYLFGTFHLLPPGHDWRSPAIDSAIAASDELVLEVAAAGDPTAAAGAMMRLGISPGLPPLAERVPPDRRPALAAMVADSGVPAAALDRMETWAAALMLAGVAFRRLGLSGEAGVEQGLAGAYKGARKPVTGLETVDEQFGFFDALPEEAQRAFLVAMLDDMADLRREFAEMLAAWTAGDVEAIAATFNDEMNLSPELREALLKRRNAKWAEWLAKRLDRPGTAFVAVGAGHLAGRDSVQRMLRAKGLKAKRVQ
jgi:uncharacterized protein YbaP (TraB family)